MTSFEKVFVGRGRVLSKIVAWNRLSDTSRQQRSRIPPKNDGRWKKSRVMFAHLNLRSYRKRRLQLTSELTVARLIKNSGGKWKLRYRWRSRFRPEKRVSGTYSVFRCFGEHKCLFVPVFLFFLLLLIGDKSGRICFRQRWRNSGFWFIIPNIFIRKSLFNLFVLFSMLSFARCCGGHPSLPWSTVTTTATTTVLTTAEATKTKPRNQNKDPVQEKDLINLFSPKAFNCETG